MDCQLKQYPGIGRCCCNCKHQMLAMKHPWNGGDAKGQISEIFGALCAVPGMGPSKQGRRRAIFMQNPHGMCECHDHIAKRRAHGAELEDQLLRKIAGIT